MPRSRILGGTILERALTITGAYEDIADVIARQTDLVEVVHHLEQVVCVNG